MTRLGRKRFIGRGVSSRPIEIGQRLLGNQQKGKGVGEAHAVDPAGRRPGPPAGRVLVGHVDQAAVPLEHAPRTSALPARRSRWRRSGRPRSRPSRPTVAAGRAAARAAGMPAVSMRSVSSPRRGRTSASRGCVALRQHDGRPCRPPSTGGRSGARARPRPIPSGARPPADLIGIHVEAGQTKLGW